MSWRFFRRFMIFPWLRLNVSKEGASVTAGPRGATITTGSSGTRVTLGLPGSGFFITRKLFGRPDPPAWLPLAQAAVAAGKNPNPTLGEYERVFALQRRLGLADGQLSPELRAQLASMRAVLDSPVKRFLFLLVEVLQKPDATSADYYAVLAQQRALGVKDTDLTPEQLDGVRVIRAKVANGDLG